MRKIVSVISACALTAATTVAPVSTPIRADDPDTTLRMYFKLPIGGSDAPIKERAQVGLQLNSDLGDTLEDRDLQIFDFQLNNQGLDKANVLGLDAIAAHDLLTGKDRLYQTSDEGLSLGSQPLVAAIVALIGVFGGVIISTAYFEGEGEEERDEAFEASADEALRESGTPPPPM